MLATATLARRLAGAIGDTAGTLLATVRPDGSWVDTLPSAAVATGSAVIALHVADRDGSAGLVRFGSRWLRRVQNADGGWGDAPGAPSTLNATAIAVAALCLVDPEDHAAAIARGDEALERLGGGAALEDRRRCTLSLVCRQFLALAGRYDESRIHRLPFELGLLPRALRQKLSFTVPGLMAWGVMQSHLRDAGPVRAAVDRLAERSALAYLTQLRLHQGPDGGYEESPLMTSIVLVGLARAGVEPEAVAECVRYLRHTVRPDGSWAVNRDLELSATMFVLLGLIEAGYAGDARLGRSLDWVAAAQRTEPFAATGCPAGGWGWSLPSGWPDTDDTANALAVLAATGRAGTPEHDRGLRWLRSMQNSDGSWGCFARNARLSLDAPCSVFTAHAVLALHATRADDRAVTRALGWLRRAQRPDGSLGCVWYRGDTAGTAAALEAFAVTGHAHEATAVRCRDRLLATQLADGGWNGGPDTGDATVEETSWAVLALTASGLDPDHPALRAAVEWLLARRGPDGRWAPALVGVYFLDLMYSDDMIATGYALAALARYERTLRAMAS